MSKFLKLIGIVALTFLLVILGFSPLFAALGKIAGTVKDAETGEPLPGANVVVVGTTMGASTDLKGRYFILNIPPGVYEVTASMIGYEPKTYTEVIVSLDVTTTLNFELAPTVIKAPKPVVVTATRPLVEKTLTSTKVVFEAERLEVLPIHTLDEALELTAETFQGHVRGGAARETKAVLDGMDVSTVWTGRGRDERATSEIGAGKTVVLNYYTKYSTTAVPGDYIRVSPLALAEAALTAGTMNAEYGGVMSGVINISTKEPGTEHHGVIRYQRTPTPKDHFGGNVYDYFLTHPDLKNDIVKAMGVSDWNPFVAGTDTAGHPYNYYYDENGCTKNSQLFELVAYGPVPGFGGRMGYLFSGRYERMWGPYPNQQSTRLDGLLKLKYQLSPTMRLDIELLSKDSGWTPLTMFKNGHQWGNTDYLTESKFCLHGMGAWREATAGVNLKFTHLLSPKTFYEIKLQQLSNWFASSSYEDWDKYTREDFERFLKEGKLYKPWIAPGVRGFWGVDYNANYFHRRFENLINLKADITSQVTFNHQIKAGVDIKLHEIDNRKNWIWAFDMVEFRNCDYVVHPKDYALYIQDRIEYGNVIMNIGLRWDGFDPAIKVPRSAYNVMGSHMREVAPDWERWQHTASEEKAFIGGLVDRTEKARFKHMLCPRLGVSHPITEKVSMYYSYGIFFQRPTFEELYYDMNVQGTYYPHQGGLVDLRPMKTTAFEMGLQWEFIPNYKADLKAFYKDMDDLTVKNGKFLRAQAEDRAKLLYSAVTVPLNFGYRDARGFEITLTRRPTGSFLGLPFDLSGSIAYAYTYTVEAVDMGLTVWEYTNPIPVNELLRYTRELPSPWDRRHRINIALDFAKRIRGINLAISTVTRIQSGVKYIPAGATVEEAEEITRVGITKEGPWTRTTDLRAKLDLPAVGFFKPSIFVDVRNLFNHKNILWIADNIEWLESKEESPDKPEWNRSERIYGPAREIWVGMSLGY